MKCRILILVLAAGLTQGCASFFCHYDYMSAKRKTGPTAYYPGTVTDIQGIGLGLSAPFRKEGEMFELIFFPLCLIDLPFTFVLDTLFVPSDFFHQREQKDRFWETAFQTGSVSAEEVRRKLTARSDQKVAGILKSEQGGAASNVVSAILEAALSKGCPRVLIAMSERQDLSPGQYRAIHDCQPRCAYDARSLVHRNLAGNPAVPLEMLVALSASPDQDVRIASLRTGRLPREIATNELTRLARSEWFEHKRQAAGNPAIPPELLAFLVDEDQAFVARYYNDEKFRDYAHAEGWDRINIASRSQGLLQAAVAANPACPAPTLDQLARSLNLSVRVAVARNPSTTPATLQAMLAGVEDEPVDRDQVVTLLNKEARQSGALAAALAGNPRCPGEALAVLARSTVVAVRVAVAGNPSSPRETVGALAGDPAAEVRAAAGADLPREAHGAPGK